MTALDFDAIERAQNRRNLDEVRREVLGRSERLGERIRHFSYQFGIPEEDYWEALENDPDGPMASVLAKEARRQNIHEKAAAEYVRGLDHVSQFQNLPGVGQNALYVNTDGQVVTRSTLGSARNPSKSLDFSWYTAGVYCIATQKYTKVGGGNQDSQFNEVESLLRNFQGRTNNSTALFVLVDGEYYTEGRMNRLRALCRTTAPKSYVTGVNSLQQILTRIVEEG